MTLSARVCLWLGIACCGSAGAQDAAAPAAVPPSADESQESQERQDADFDLKWRELLSHAPEEVATTLEIIPDPAANVADVGRRLSQSAWGAGSLLSVSEVPDPGPALAMGRDLAFVTFTDLPPTTQQLEHGIGASNFLPASFLDRGAHVQRAVCRIRTLVPRMGASAGSGWGTGFLVSDSLVMTNHHVMWSEEVARTLDAQFNFQMGLDGSFGPEETFSFDPESAFVTSAELDYTIIRVRPRATDGATAGSRWGQIVLSPEIYFFPKQALNIVQHPWGRPKEVALQDNQLHSVHVSVFRYATDTERGSSGAPVFDNGWNLVGLHHAAGEEVNGQYVNNEGVRMDVIIADLRRRLVESPSGTALLLELHL